MVTDSLERGNEDNNLSNAFISFSVVVKMNVGVSPGNALLTVFSFKSGSIEDSEVLAIALVFLQFL